jgi:hypothetical protein
MQATRLHWLIATENRKLLWVAILWTAGLASIYSQALFTRAYASWLEQGIAAALCFAAGALIGNIGRSLVVYLGAIVSTIVIIIFMATQPLSPQYLDSAGIAIIQRLLLIAVFREVFPFPLILSLASSLIGSLVGERYV